MKVIIVTGSPGTGKTTLSKKLAKSIGFIYVDVNKIINEQKISEGYDSNKKCLIVDTKKLSDELISMISEFKKNKGSVNGVIIDSHLSHYLPSKYVGLCIVTKCELKKLKERLTKRGYSKNKIRDNLDAEIFNVCFEEANNFGHKILVVDTSHGIDKDLLKLIKI